MGLYDTPLPPRQPPNSQKNESSTTTGSNDTRNESQTVKDEEEETATMTERLFEFDENGKEVHDLLPPLKRRLVHGIGCYYEPTDRIVINLIDKTSVHPEDACWALEACNGDITEAWTRISTARRIILEQQRSSSSIIHDDDIVSPQKDDDDELLWKEFQNRKQTFERRQQKQRGYFDDGTTSMPPPDQPWLPNPNPRPVDDEPWFTG